MGAQNIASLYICYQEIGQGQSLLIKEILADIPFVWLYLPKMDVVGNAQNLRPMKILEC